MEVPHVEVEVLLAIQGEHALGLPHWHSPGARSLRSPIDQTVVTTLFKPVPVATHVPIAHPQDLRRLHPSDLLTHRPKNYFLKLHCPLHGPGRIHTHALSPGVHLISSSPVR